MASPPDLMALLQAARHDDAGARDALLAGLLPVIRGHARLLCHAGEDAEDAAQEAMLLVHRHLDSLTSDEALIPWVWTLTRSACQRLRRRRRVSTEGGDRLDDVEDDGLSPEDLAQLQDRARRVRAAIASLPPGDRSVLVLRDLQGLDGTEAARRLGLSLEALKSRLHRARQHLRQALLTLPAPRADHDLCLQVSLHLEGDLREADCEALQAALARDPALLAECEAIRQMLGLCRQSPWEAGPGERGAGV
jgi:RNA polymerase sigma factor (sigma-70 family)